MIRNPLSPKQVMKITNETRQHIQYWYVNGLIRPYDEGGGIGSARYYSYENLAEIYLIKILFRYFRNNIKSIKVIFSKILEQHPDFFSSIERFWDEKRIIAIAVNHREEVEGDDIINVKILKSGEIDIQSGFEEWSRSNFGRDHSVLFIPVMLVDTMRTNGLAWFSDRLPSDKYEI